MAATVVAKEAGAAPIMVVGLAPDRRRLELCRRLGADLCVCSDEEDAAAVLSRETRGRMPAPPAWEQGYERLPADPDDAVRRLADLTAVRFGDPRVVPQLRSMVANPDADRGSGGWPEHRYRGDRQRPPVWA